MKIFITIFISFVITDMCKANECNDINNLLDAIKIVESKNGKYLNGKNGESGPYQIKRIVIDDVNRILGKKIFKYDNVLDDNKSREICRIYILYWSKRYNVNTIESMARIWNGGPRGYRKESTIEYWRKIRRVLDEL
jgi:hypothetical protein